MNKKWLALSGLILWVSPIFAELPFEVKDTWANWQKRYERGFDGIQPYDIPGRTMGIIVPSDTRQDLIPMSAFGYETLARERMRTIIYLMKPPDGSTLSGLALPDTDVIETSFGRFTVDIELAREFETLGLNVEMDAESFTHDVPDILETQLAALKFVLSHRSGDVMVLPIFVQFSDLNSDVKDYAPLFADKIKDLYLEQDIIIVIAANLTLTSSKDLLVQVDSQMMNAIRNFDVDAVINLVHTEKPEDTLLAFPDIDVLAMGLLSLRWLESDHGKILAYGHSGQLVLTKDKNIPQSYVSAAFGSGAADPPRIPHMQREKLLKKFDEVLRTDILSMTRQTVASTLDPTAAKPPTLIQKVAGKKWPAYVSLYDDKGNLAGQAGAHKAVAPLQESLRRYAYEAARKAQPELTKDNFSSYVVDVSIPFGNVEIDQPDDLVPLLHGVIVHQSHKEDATPPDAWRKYPDPHQLLGVICYKLGMKPWAYATSEAWVESFRTISFNEKEPFQDLGAEIRKKKKKKKDDEEDFDAGSGGGDLLLPF